MNVLWSLGDSKATLTAQEEADAELQTTKRESSMGVILYIVSKAWQTSCCLEISLIQNNSIA